MNKKILLVVPFLGILSSFNTSCNKTDETKGSLNYIENSNGYCVDSLNNMNRSKITDIVVPATHNGKPVNEISKGAFKGCTNLVNITLPFIGHTAQSTGVGGLFGYVFGDEMWEDGGAYTWQTYSLSDEYEALPTDYAQFVIPKTLRNITITNASLVSPGAFSMCKYLRSITFADTCNVAELGNFSFYNCNSLKTFNFPNGLKTIGRQAFNNCYNLLELKIPSGVETIKHNAFSDCYSLIRTYIPKTVDYMGKLIFNNIQAGVILLASKEPGKNWDNEWSNKDSTVVYDYDNGGFYYTNDCEYALCGEGDDKYAFLMQWTGNETGDITIKGKVDIEGKTYDVRTIGPRVFQGYEITKITLEEGIRVISPNCFEGCPDLKTAIFPSTLETIGANAFASCPLLGESENASDNIIDLKSIKTIGKEAFKDCAKLRNIKLGDKLETVGESAFENDERLMPGVLVSTAIYEANPLVFPSTLKTIGKAAFKGCFKVNSEATTTYYPGIKFATNNNAEIDIEESAFENIGYKSTITSEYKTYIRVDIDFGKDNATKYKQFNKNIFRNTYLRRVFNFPTSLEKIDDYAFYAARISYISTLSEDETTITDTRVLDFSTNQSLTTIGTYAFYYNDMAFEFKDSKLESIGNYAFQSNSYSGFQTLHLPNSLANIGAAAFNSCSQIQQIHFPNNSSFTTLNSSAFSGMTNLVSSIDDAGNAETADTLTIPASVTYISSSVFSSNIKLVNVKFKSNQITYVGSSCFSSCRALVSVDFTNLSHCKTFGSNMFNGCTSLTTVKGFENGLPSGNKAIGDSCYYGCTSLTTQKISANIQTVGAKAYMNCTGLTKVEFDGNITHLYASCFANCTSLNSFKMPASVHTICDYAFQNCTSLGKGKTNPFELPKNISQKYDTSTNMGIGENVFSGWTSSQYIKVNANNIESISTEGTITLRWGWTLKKTATEGEYTCNEPSLVGGNPIFIYNA